MLWLPEESSKVHITLMLVKLVATLNMNTLCFMTVFIRSIWHYCFQEVTFNAVYFTYSMQQLCNAIFHCLSSCKNLPIPQLAIDSCADDAGKASATQSSQFCCVLTQSFLSKLHKWKSVKSRTHRLVVV